MPDTQNKKPPHLVHYVIDRGDDKKAIWNRIGAAWEHDDKEGMTLDLDFLPVKDTGRIVIRTRRENETGEGEQ